jgi:hypothetical protein
MMFHTWQDAVIFFCNIFFTLTLIPMLVNRNTKVPRYSSVPTAIALSVMSVTFATLALAWSAAICGINGLLWFGVAILRPTTRP